jgi:cyclic-di-AMP phosphodiesterase PgpH
MTLFERFTHRFGRSNSDTLGAPQKERTRTLECWLIGFGLVIALALLFPVESSFQFDDLKEGRVSNRRIVAPVNFEILKNLEEYEKDKLEAIRNLFPIFIPDETAPRSTMAASIRFWSFINFGRRTADQNPTWIPAVQDSLMMFPGAGMDSLWKAWIEPASRVSSEKLSAIRLDVEKILMDLYRIGVMDRSKSQFSQFESKLILARADSETVLTMDRFLDSEEAVSRARQFLSTRFGKNEADAALLVFRALLRPNMVYDEPLHRQRIDDAISKVPLSSGFVYENEKIVDRNERITPDIRRELVSLASKLSEQNVRRYPVGPVLFWIGRAAFVTIVLFLFAVFVGLEQPGILRSVRSTLLMAIILLLTSLFTSIIHRLGGSEYLVPVPMGAMLLAMLFNTPIGCAGAAVLGILAGGLWGLSFDLQLVSFFTGVVGVLAVQRIRDRSQLIKIIFYLAGAFILAITFTGLLRFMSFREIIALWPYGLLNGLFSPILTFGLLPIAETVFDVTTDYSLLELSNLNHPLLKKLSLEAPGTYHHSVIVGNLAEAAAQAVSANSLLARVGSSYHDIGKIDKAEYFVENQMGEENPHEKLMPRMSALILGNHVKQGLELADEYRLPTTIRNIIQQHHGTTVMPFFYQKALEKNGEEVHENDYRYLGPKPQTKESAIVMLADAVEASARALREPTHSRLKGLIIDLVEERFQEGQLNEAPLTLADLEKIKDSFLTILAATFHARVGYDKED